MLHPEDPVLRDGTAVWALRILVEQVALVLGTLAAMLPPKDPRTRGWCRGVGAADPDGAGGARARHARGHAPS